MLDLRFGSWGVPGEHSNFGHPKGFDALASRLCDVACFCIEELRTSSRPPPLSLQPALERNLGHSKCTSRKALNLMKQEFISLGQVPNLFESPINPTKPFKRWPDTNI